MFKYNKVNDSGDCSGNSKKKFASQGMLCPTILH